MKCPVRYRYLLVGDRRRPSLLEPGRSIVPPRVHRGEKVAFDPTAANVIVLPETFGGCVSLSLG
jgi:hypothetical protein